MATNTWSSTGSTDGNLGSNWSLGVLSATDDLTFNATSVINCTFTGAISCNTIVATTGYTGILSSGGQTLTIASTVNIATGRTTAGSIVLSGTWIQTGDANFTLDCGTGGTISATNGNIDLRGSGTLTFLKGISNTVLNSFTCAYSSKTTLLSSAVSISSRSLIFAGNGTLTCNSILVIDVASVYALTQGTATWNGTAQITVQISAAITLTINAVNYTGSAVFVIQTANTSAQGASITNLAGNVSCGGTLRIIKNNTGSSTFNTNNYNIVSAALQAGNANATNQFTFNFGTSTISCTSLDISSSYNLQITNFNFSSCAISVTANIAFGTNATVSTGTSTITLSGSSTANISNSPYTKIIPRIILDKSANVNITNSTSFTCKGFSTASSNLGTLVFSGYSIWSNGDFLYDYGNISQSGVLNATIYMTVLNSTFRISTTGSVNTQYLYFNLQNSIIFDPTNSGNRSISRLIVTAGKTITWVPNVNKLIVLSYTAGDYSGTSGNVSTWVSQTPGTQYNVFLQSGIVPTYFSVTDCNNSGNNVNASSTTNVNGGNDVGFYFGDLTIVHTGIRAYVFQCSYNGADWLDNPSTLISQLKTALSSITNLNSYLQLKVANVRNSTKKEIEIEIVSIVYLSKTRLTAAENDSLITDIETALNTITYLIYDHVNIVNDIFREHKTFNWAQSMQKDTVG